MTWCLIKGVNIKVAFDSFKDRTTNIVRQPNSENCLDLIYVPSPCEKVVIVPDANYIILSIRKLMLDMPSPGTLQDIGL